MLIDKTIKLKIDENISTFYDDILYVHLFNNKRINKYCYSEISFTVGSDRTEAIELAGLCTIRVSRERCF